jgi:hypothetical protein
MNYLYIDYRIWGGLFASGRFDFAQRPSGDARERLLSEIEMTYCKMKVKDAGNGKKTSEFGL